MNGTRCTVASLIKQQLNSKTILQRKRFQTCAWNGTFLLNKHDDDGLVHVNKIPTIKGFDILRNPKLNKVGKKVNLRNVLSVCLRFFFCD